MELLCKISKLRKNVLLTYINSLNNTKMWNIIKIDQLVS